MYRTANLSALFPPLWNTWNDIVPLFFALLEEEQNTTMEDFEEQQERVIKLLEQNVYRGE